jgi:hypothetical protein
MSLRNKHLSILWPLFPVLIAISFWFGVKAGGDNLLKDEQTARSGIGSLERAGTVSQAQWIIKSWNRKAPDRRTQSEIKNPKFLSFLSNDGRLLTAVAKRSLVFDLFFILFYASTLAVACLLAATELAVRRRKQEESRLVGAGIRLANAQIITASFDLLENFALWRMLEGSTWKIWPWVAYVCSIAKWSFIVISLTYVLIALVFWVIDHRQDPQKSGATAATA